jgi:hypothetical protein
MLAKQLTYLCGSKLQGLGHQAIWREEGLQNHCHVRLDLEDRGELLHLLLLWIPSAHVEAVVFSFQGQLAQLGQIVAEDHLRGEDILTGGSGDIEKIVEKNNVIATNAFLLSI